jgi:Zinc carboxypeptidase
MRTLILLCFVAVIFSCTPAYKAKRTSADLRKLPNYGITLPFERDTNQTCTWQEAIAAYQQLAKAQPRYCTMTEAGISDGGKPIHVFIFSPNGEFRPGVQRVKTGGHSATILINNGIHPGEPEGIDATILFVHNALQRPDLLRAWNNLTFVIIPIYNVDGALNRSSHSRANQNGPTEYGFRGNARNLDLNRDFIKNDSENARTFTRIFQTWQPDILIDNHTSNGADYQYTMTLLPTLADKLAPAQTQLLKAEILPALYTDMAKKGWPMAPYVNEIAGVPDSGILGFLDSPRYGSGYAALFHCLGFTTETHMLKPFAQRLRGTEALMHTIAQYASTHAVQIRQAKTDAAEYWAKATTFPLDWAPDLSRPDSIWFRGYAGLRIPSRVHQGERTYYDRNQPFEKRIPFYNTFSPKNTIKPPKSYIIPQAWHEVVERLRQNNVPLISLANDTAIWVTSYRIKDFQTRNAYEGHYLHYQISVDTIRHIRQFQAGDWLVPIQNTSLQRYHPGHTRFAIETLEPTAPDSYFAWNAFDGVLMQKEYFSDYVFEDLAEEWLAKNPKIKAELVAKMAADAVFAKDGDAVLRWVYLRSPWYEGTHRVYPVARIE